PSCLGRSLCNRDISDVTRRQQCCVCTHSPEGLWVKHGVSCIRLPGEAAMEVVSSPALCRNPSGEPGSSAGHRGISVVGIPDPITWIRCKVIMYLIELYFELGITSVEFDNGVKQMVNYVEKKCKSLTDAQRQQLAISMDDIIFLLPEDVSVFFDQNGRKFCFVVMRFWLLSTLEGPDDPEGSKIFKVTSDEDGGPRRKIVTAVYE
uniref:Si:dkey-82o10.4 n=1 Tax=Myripristis murdjan TaxID=586833 RepID=A0A667WVM8_9TELE